MGSTPIRVSRYNSLMHLSSLSLQNFRSFKQKDFKFSSKTNLILGNNGAGKTNLLEAIDLLTSGTSFRQVSLSKLIHWQQSFTTIQTALNQAGDSTKLEVQLIKRPDFASISRKFLIADNPKTRKEFLGTLKTVIFFPEDIRLTTGSPGRRRRFLDSVFTGIDWRYSQSLTQYTKALNHRNELLDQIRQNQSSPKELWFWDQSLIKNDEIIHKFRQLFINFANQFFQKHPHSEIQKIFLNYQPRPLSPVVLQKNYSLDLKRGYTQSGNHRDDFSFDSFIFPDPDKNLANWGSRGQQRLAVLALRLAQIEFIKFQKKQNPVLLLDDIFSELDDNHRRLVGQVSSNHQTFFTSSEDNVASFLNSPHLIKL